MGISDLIYIQNEPTIMLGRILCVSTGFYVGVAEKLKQNIIIAMLV